ncbi:MAG: extracellular solute-binding protein [Elusimicrobia bacterium]|nr:extracellular solute-binding protein [Elusimicrobiota bacterium]
MARWAGVSCRALLALAVPAGGEDLAAGAPLSGKVVLFHAGSLAAPLRQVSELFEKKHPGVKVLAEASGSRDSARKILDLGRACDVLALADYRVAEELLMPRHAEFNIRFASNEMAIAFSERSRGARAITEQNWPEVLLSSGVAFGRSDPNRDPCGYRTEMVFQLAERHYRLPGLAGKLMAKDARYIRPKETDLLALLESGEIDYLFIYRSVVRQRRLRSVAMPDAVNLKDPGLNKDYAKAQARITGAAPGEFVTLKGEAIAYSVTIPLGAANRPAAEAYVALMLSSEGRAVMAANGQEPLRPALAGRADKVPAALRRFCRQEALR